MKFIVLLAMVIAIYVYMYGMPGDSKGVFDASGNPQVQLFTFPGCGEPCNSMLKNLKSRGVGFSHYDVDPDDQQTEAYERWSKYSINSFPLVIAGNDKLTNSSNAQLAMMLGKNFGMEFLTSREKAYYAEHFYADGSPRIVLYGTDWCPSCAQLRKDFNAMGVEFVDIDVEKPRLKKTLLQDLEINGYPATWVGFTRINSSKASVIVDALESY